MLIISGSKSSEVVWTRFLSCSWLLGCYNYTACVRGTIKRPRDLHVCSPAAAPVWVTRPQDSRLEEGKPGYLHCHAKATPEPEVTWLRNNIMITAEVSCHGRIPHWPVWGLLLRLWRYVDINRIYVWLPLWSTLIYIATHWLLDVLIVTHRGHFLAAIQIHAQKEELIFLQCWTHF